MSLWTPFMVLLLILINALYVAAEFAAISVRLTRVEQLAAQGRRLAAGLLPILRDAGQLDRYIAGCQIGITLSSLVLGAFGQATIGLALGRLLAEHGLLEPVSAYALSATVTLVLLTSLQVIFGELIPKSLALQYPVGTALLTYPPMRWSQRLFAPFIRLLNGSGTLILRRLGVSAESSHRHVHAPEEIEFLIRESRQGGLLQDKESERLREAIQLAQHRVRHIMVPRGQIARLDLDAPLPELLAVIDASPYTRLVVHRGGLDEVLGYLHVKDLVVAMASGSQLDSLQALVRPLLILPSSLSIDRALSQLRDEHARIALVVDEYGDAEGLISLEDIIRELLGELSDEFKSLTGQTPTPLPDGRWRLPGRLSLEAASEWAQSLGAARFEATHAETLAGWMLEQLETVPAGALCLHTDEMALEIERMTGAAIESVIVWIPETVGGDAHD